MSKVQIPRYSFKLSEHDADPIVTLTFVGHGLDQIEAQRVAADLQDHYAESMARIIGAREATKETPIDAGEVRAAVATLVIVADRIVRENAA